LQIAQIRKQQLTEITKELSETQAKLLELRERMTAANDLLSRMEIPSPIDGYVVGLTTFTRGGVINRGDRLLDVVPADAELIIEAMVRPEDIESVKVGAIADVRLTAFKQRELPRIDGHVKNVSADRLTDQKSGTSFFTVLISLDQQQLVAAGLPALQPGMPAEIFIRTNERTVLSYLLSPLAESLRHAFREK
jgi:HlyD family type I secretion membrane fusion protein